MAILSCNSRLEEINDVQYVRNQMSLSAGGIFSAYLQCWDAKCNLFISWRLSVSLFFCFDYTLNEAGRGGRGVRGAGPKKEKANASNDQEISETKANAPIFTPGMGVSAPPPTENKEASNKTPQQAFQSNQKKNNNYT